MKIYSYIVTSDTGFAPNPFHGFCTLACCKPKIRKGAAVGDLIIGLSSRSERFIYAMKVSKVIGFPEYWSDAKYAPKRPIKNTGRSIDSRGDNIYEPIAIGEFRQLHSFHSNDDGTERPADKEHDLGGENVLVADRFTYFGAGGPPVPPQMEFLKAGRGHRCRFTPDQIVQVAQWFEALPPGVRGRPGIWSSSDTTWQQA